MGYCNYRWELDPPESEADSEDEIEAVGYVYELQLEPRARGHGLARHLMDVVGSWVRAACF